MNCGDWVESCTALAEDADGVFHVLDWSRVNPNLELTVIEPTPGQAAL